LVVVIKYARQMWLGFWIILSTL